MSAAKLRETSRLLVIGEGLAKFGHWRSDATDPNLELSAQASEIAGVRRNRMLSWRQALRMVDRRDRGNLLRCIVGARTGATGVSCRIRLCRPDGEPRHIVLQVLADDRPDGSLSGLVGVIRDITDLVAAQERLIAARDDAEAANRAKSEFLATMSHEIRTPMTGVMGMIELLRSTPTEEERERYLGAMQQSAELLMAVIDGILDFSKVESGKLEIEPRDFDIEELARRTLDMFQNSASKKGLIFDLKVAAGTSPIVHGDPVRIQQVISNLVSNAIKFTERGNVALSIRAHPRRDSRQLWRVQVKDTGIGIAPDELGKLFEPFVQMGNRRFGGTGLGLAISRRLVEAMGGKTGVRSVPGRGSTFWFELELATGAALEAVAAPNAQPVGRVRPLQVLVAEDNPINQMLVAALVRRLGHQVTCVDNGQRAVEVTRTARFDCILVDMQMPVMDGIAATRAIRSGNGPNATVPIIALTADAAPERRRFYDNVGLTDFMTKPVSVDALRRHLGAIVPSLVSSSVEVEAVPIDAERVAELRLVIGPAKFETLLRMFARELTDRPAEIRRCAASADLTALRSHAHSLCGAVANLGAIGVERAARSLEIAAEGPECELALARLDVETARARLAIAQLLDEPPTATDRLTA